MLEKKLPMGIIHCSLAAKWRHGLRLYISFLFSLLIWEYWWFVLPYYLRRKLPQWLPTHATIPKRLLLYFDLGQANIIIDIESTFDTFGASLITANRKFQRISLFLRRNIVSYHIESFGILLRGLLPLLIIWLILEEQLVNTGHVANCNFTGVRLRTYSHFSTIRLHSTHAIIDVDYY